MTYTITRSRRQIMIETSDGQRWLYPRSIVGLGSADRKVAALEAVGYTEGLPTPPVFSQLLALVQGTTNDQQGATDDPAGTSEHRPALD